MVQNNLLMALPPTVRELLLMQLQPEWLAEGDVLHEAGKHMASMYFPEDALVSLRHVMDSGYTVHAGLVGSDGMAGAPLLFDRTLMYRAVVISPGYAYRMDADAIRFAFTSSVPLQRVLLQYIQTLLSQLAQNAICGRTHTPEQQLCRWLLLIMDRVPPNIRTYHQDLIARAMGSPVDVILGRLSRLEAAGAITRVGDCVLVLSRLRLEQCCCGCYGSIGSGIEYERLQ